MYVFVQRFQNKLIVRISVRETVHIIFNPPPPLPYQASNQKFSTTSTSAPRTISSCNVCSLKNFKKKIVGLTNCIVLWELMFVRNENNGVLDTMYNTIFRYLQKKIHLGNKHETFTIARREIWSNETSRNESCCFTSKGATECLRFACAFPNKC